MKTMQDLMKEQVSHPRGSRALVSLPYGEELGDTTSPYGEGKEKSL